MAYRRTEKVSRRLAARRDAIVAAARELASESGMAAVQIALVAERAGIAAGTVYRYFPAKAALVTAVVSAVAEREIAAVRGAADSAPGALSALSAAIATFAARALRNRRLTWAVLAEPVDPEIDAVRLLFRKALAAEFAARVRAVIGQAQLTDQEAAIAAPALVGTLIEGLIGPLAPPAEDRGQAQATVRALTLFALRALGIADAHARGLVVQTALPVLEGDA